MFAPARWLSLVTANKFCIQFYTKSMQLFANGACPNSSKRKYTVSLIDIQHMRFINETHLHWLNVNLFKSKSPSFVSKRFQLIKVSVDTKYTKYQWKGISLLTIHVKSKEILISCFTFSRRGSSSLTSMLLASGVERLSTIYASSTICSSLRSGSVLITWK